MKRITTTLFFTFVLILTINAQDTITVNTGRPSKSFFAELGGNGIVFSANFDSRFTKSEKGLGYRLGIGFVPGIDFLFFKTSTLLTIPFGINHLAGKGPGYFESGLGATYISGTVGVGSLFEEFVDENDVHASWLVFVPSIGYRYASIGKGFQGRIFISPLIGSGGAIIWLGASVGFKF